MPIVAAKLIAEIGADTSKLSSALKQSSDSLESFASKSLKVGTVLTAGITAPAVAAATGILKVGIGFEQSTVAFTTMLKSGEKAKKFLDDLRDFAKHTPFEFVELQDAAKRMMAFGFAAEDVIPILTDVGDAAAGLSLGNEGINRIILALGQMQAKAKVSGEEMRQLTEAGIPAWRYLAEAMGMTTAEVMKMSEQGLIPADKAIQNILAGMQKDFGGMMAAQAKTAGGQVSNLKDDINELATEMSEYLLPTFKEAVADLRDLVEKFSELPDGVKKATIEIGGLLAVLGPAMIGVSAVTTAVSGLSKALPPVIAFIKGYAATLVPVAGIVAALGTATVFAVKQQKEASAALQQGQNDALKLSKSYEEYVKTAKDVAEQTGFVVDAMGNLTHDTQGYGMAVVQQNWLLSESEYNAVKAEQAHMEIMTARGEQMRNLGEVLAETTAAQLGSTAAFDAMVAGAQGTAGEFDALVGHIGTLRDQIRQMNDDIAGMFETALSKYNL